MDTSQLPKDQFATVGSLNIRCWETGEHETPVILVHVGSAGLGKSISMIHRMTSLPILSEHLIKPNRKNISGLYKSLVYDNATITENMVDLGCFPCKKSRAANQKRYSTCIRTMRPPAHAGTTGEI